MSPALAPGEVRYETNPSGSSAQSQIATVAATVTRITAIVVVHRVMPGSVFSNTSPVSWFQSCTDMPDSWLLSAPWCFFGYWVLVPNPSSGFLTKNVRSCPLKSIPVRSCHIFKYDPADMPKTHAIMAHVKTTCNSVEALSISRSVLECAGAPALSSALERGHPRPQRLISLRGCNPKLTKTDRF